MSLVKVSGNASGTGTLTIAAPNTNTDYTLTLPQATTTLVGTDATQTLTNKTIQGGAITSGTAVASTSGTSIDFTGIPSWVKRLTVMLSGVSVSGTSNLACRIGDGSISASGYASGATRIGTTGAVATSTAAYLLTGDNGSASVHHGSVVITNISGNSWTAYGVLSRSDDGFSNISGGSKTLTGTLDRVRITTGNGTDTFDAGSINIMYEG